MLTCKSPRKVLRVAYHLAKAVLPSYASRFSRKDFTLPQLFACLVLREHQGRSYRGTEALLRDCRHWCRAIGMRKAPDHNTLCRAFQVIVSQRNIDKMLDLLVRWFDQAGQLGTTAAIDSSLYDTHHRSRHYEQRCRQNSSNDRGIVSDRRSASCKKTPKLTIASTLGHVILAAWPRTGMGADYKDFVPVVRDAHRRCKLEVILADAGYDSQANHRLVREELGAVSLIKSGSGRPTSKPPSGQWRREMKLELQGSQKGRPYGQRSQVETTNSMMKRNLGDSLRARSAQGRAMEQMLRVVTHNVMLFLLHFSRVETEPDVSSYGLVRLSRSSLPAAVPRASAVPNRPTSRVAPYRV
jgi:IS5 family transposase